MTRNDMRITDNKRLAGLFGLVLGLVLTVGSLGTAHATQTVTYYHTNALGSPVAATDGAGNVLWREAYEPYGLRLIKDANSTGNSRYFTGHPEDSSIGLTYMGSRFYDPRVGRFLSPDPQRFKETNLASFNRYAYGNHNPYKFVDPDGEAVTLTIPVVVVGTALVFGGGIILSKSPMWQQISNNDLTLPGFGSQPPLLIPSTSNAKPPENAYDPNGPKAPGKPGPESGFNDPKGGVDWAKNPNPGRGGSSHGWRDDKGRVWAPTGQSPGRAHGGPHWDVQLPDGGHVNVNPGESIDDKL